MSIHYAIDSLTIRNGRLFGWGWFLDTDSQIRTCSFVVTSVGGGVQRIACVFSGMRPDLQAAYPDAPHAAAAGFMLQSHLDAEPDRSIPARLEVEYPDGRVESREISPEILSRCPQGMSGLQPRVRAFFAAWRSDAKASGERAALSHALGRLSAKLRDRQGRAPGRIRALRGHPVALVFDHDMGGGANRYRCDFVRTLVDSGTAVIVIAPRLASLDHAVCVQVPGKRPVKFHVDDPAPTLEALSAVHGLHIHVNELISFHDPYAIMDWCIEARDKYASKLTFHVHDYYSACPAWTLIAVDGRFCGVPSIVQCKACLPRNIANTMGFTREKDQVVWRERWGQLLSACDEIIAFSSASVNILRQAHPALPIDRVRVRPHKVDAAALRPVTPTHGDVFVIAVAGHISRPKGADMLREMAFFAQRDSLPLQIVVIGTLEGHRQSDPIHVLGGFKPHELPDYLESVGASICFLPSICAETYSFVTDEYMAMRMPVVVFPIGAPAERVALYEDGLVLSRIDAEIAVREILDFVKRLRKLRSNMR